MLPESHPIEVWLPCFVPPSLKGHRSPTSPLLRPFRIKHSNMATEAPRRSTRVRTQVKSYADEQADDVANRKRKSTSQDVTESATKKPAKKSKKTQKTQDSDGYEEDVAPPITQKASKAASNKPKRTATNSSWHGEAAQRRIAATNRKVKRLAPGQEETRLRE